MSAAPEDDAANRAALLEQVRIRMVDNLMHLPDYTCLQTIERTTRRAPSRRFELIDQVRLEVALVNGQEMFGWPGAGKFDDREIDKIVTGGAIGNGNFALHAKSVFQGRPEYTFFGEKLVNGRDLLRWDYRVPRGTSGYVIRVNEKQAIVGFHGSFWVDAKSLDVLRLEVNADDIPLDLHLLQAGDAVEYSRVKIGDAMFLLPQASELHMLDDDDTESLNRVRFSSCHQYLGESKLIFTDPVENGKAAGEALETVRLPEGVDLDLDLETPVRFDSSAVGDPLTFVLRKAVKHSGEVLMEKGALAHGRITLLRRRSMAPQGFALGIHLFEIQSAKKRASLNVVLDEATLVGSMSPGSFRSGVDFRREMYAGILPKAPGSVFFIPGNVLSLMKGTPTLWRTVRETNDGDKQ